MNGEHILTIKNYLLNLQTTICDALAAEEKQHVFQIDHWKRAEGGGGISCILEDGHIIERAGINFSHVYGKQLPPSATKTRPDLSGQGFEALGISLVIHPRNPFVPTTHMNLRFFIAHNGNSIGLMQKDEKQISNKADRSHKPKWWFGGGFDLTPYYGFGEDCVHWHSIAKNACTPFGPELYNKYKKWCDEYFFIKHRNEPRGIGGIFFDDLNEWEFEKCFAFVENVGNHFLPAYLPILQKRKNHPYTDEERKFQLYRRGRYVEFNLIYDRGTLFGLQSNGRVESILMSLPPHVDWRYNWQPKPNSKEEKLYKEFLVVKDWI